MLWGNHSAFIFYIWTFNTNSCSAILCYRFNILLRSYSWNWFLNKIFLRSLDNTALIPALPREPLSIEQADSRNSPFNLADLGHTMSGAFKRHFLVLTSSVLLVLEDGCNSLVDRWHHLNGEQRLTDRAEIMTSVLLTSTRNQNKNELNDKLDIH